MLEALNRIARHYPGMPVRVSAQNYLEHFYNSLGFYANSDIYEEDGIPHRHMLQASLPAFRRRPEDPPIAEIRQGRDDQRLFPSQHAAWMVRTGQAAVRTTRSLTLRVEGSL